MRLVFRADASNSIGSGHVMRCSAIAEEAKLRGIQCVLVGDLDGITWIKNRITELGIEYFPNSWEFISQIKSNDVLVIDSYQINTEDFFLKPDIWGLVVSIADPDTPNYISDLIIHPGLSSDWFKGDPRNFFTGSKFIPLRKSISKSKMLPKPNIEKIVVFGGGIDAFGFAEKIASEIANFPDFEKAVFFSESKNTIHNMDSRFTVLPFGKNLDAELLDAEFVITTASTSCMEIIAREIPLAVVCTVQNQLSYYEELKKLNLAFCLGKRSTEGKWEIDSQELEKIFSDHDLRYELRARIRGVVDLKGSSRIIDTILSALKKRGGNV